MHYSDFPHETANLRGEKERGVLPSLPVLTVVFLLPIQQQFHNSGPVAGLTHSFTEVRP